MIVECNHCEYGWDTRSKMYSVSCPRCGKKVKIKGESGPDKDQGKASNIIKNEKEDKAKCHKTQMKME